MAASETQVVKFDITEAAIAALTKKYGLPTVPTNKDEYEELKVGIKEVRDIRVAIDNARKEQTAAALAHQRAVNKMGNGIIEKLKAIESPMKLCIQEVDEAEELALAAREEAEAKRLEAIHGRLDRITEYGTVSINDNLEEVRKRLVRVEELDPRVGFDEFAKKAAEAKEVAFINLHAAIVKLEQSADLDRRTKEIEEREAKANKALAEAEAKEKKRKADEQAAEQRRLRILEDEQADRDMKAAAEVEEERQAALAPDKDKLRAFAQALCDIDTPVMTSNEGMMAVDRVIEQITTLVFDIESEADRL